MKTIKVSNESHQKLTECASKQGCSIASAFDNLIRQGEEVIPASLTSEAGEDNFKTKQEVHKMTEFCPECLKKDIAIDKATDAHKAEVEKLTNAAQVAQSRADALAKELERSKEAPDFDSFISHCKTCPTHKASLEAYNEKLLKDYVNGISRDTAIEIARAKGVDLMPESISLGPELSRRIRE